ncbi:MAG TPA: motility associated factor glycosyltransferase family protein [Clostridium sp.]|nr:motility associated factor glycosyltransferase family protein [Clostridium sp.]
MTMLQNNLELLKKRYPDIYNEIKDVHVNSNAYHIVENSEGQKTLKVTQSLYGENKSFFLHSKYHPDIVAERFAQEQYKPEFSVHILYGFGLGYHLEKIAGLLGPDSRLYVVENNLMVFRSALENMDLVSILENPCISLIVSKDVVHISKRVRRLMDDNYNKFNFITHPASLKAIPDENEYFKFVMENWNLKKSLTDDYDNTLHNNASENLKLNSPNAGILFDKFKNVPIIIVSTGPSLEKNIDLLKEAKDRALIISAGSALRPLLMRNIVPDFFAIIDPQKETYNQIKGYENIGIPLIYLATAASYTISHYLGPKLVAYYGKYNDGSEYVVDSGGSVATTILDIAIKMGGNPIILVGQDLAYVDGKNHAQHGSHASIYTQELKNMRRVKGQNGEILYTSFGYLSYKYWIENRIEKEQRIFINATEGGAYIEGMKHIKLRDVISDYLKKSFNFEEEIKSILKESGNQYV